jgi:hypothetical protein
MLQIAANTPQPPGGRRVSNAEVQRRLVRVEGMLAKGTTRSEIVSQMGLPERTTDEYIARVQHAWRVQGQSASQDARSRAQDRLLALRERLLAERAWSPLVRVEQLLCELEGVRNGPPGPPEASTRAPSMSPPQPTAAWISHRAALLVRAAVHLARSSESEALRHQLCEALERGLEALGDSAAPAKGLEP